MVVIVRPNPCCDNKFLFCRLISLHFFFRHTSLYYYKYYYNIPILLQRSIYCNLLQLSRYYVYESYLIKIQNKQDDLVNFVSAKIYLIIYNSSLIRTNSDILIFRLFLCFFLKSNQYCDEQNK